MAVTKTIAVDGKDVTFRASAAIPRLYRNKFHRDIYRDLNELQKGIDENSAGESNLDTFSLELFENIAWLMARHADSAVPDSPEEWLDGFNFQSYIPRITQGGPGSTMSGTYVELVKYIDQYNCEKFGFSKEEIAAARPPIQIMFG